MSPDTAGGPGLGSGGEVWEVGEQGELTEELLLLLSDEPALRDDFPSSCSALLSCSRENWTEVFS